MMHVVLADRSVNIEIFFTDYDVTKHADFTHVKRSFGSDLYKAKAQIKTKPGNSTLTDSVISFLEKCFCCALYQNKNDVNGLEVSLKAIVPHAF